MEHNDNERSVLISVLAGIGVGVLVGAIAGLLLAPRAGAETRQNIGTTLSEMGQKISELSQQVASRVRTAVEHGKQAVADQLEETGETKSETERRHVYHTPHGDLIVHHVKTRDNAWREVDFPVHNADELRGLMWLHRNMTYHFNPEPFKRGQEYMGDRGEPQFWVPKGPYQALAQTWMKLPDFIAALLEDTDLVEEVMAAIDASYDTLYEEIAQSGMVKILNFGENVHEALMCPDYFKRYHIPFYAKRCAQMRQAGIFTHVHIDGNFKSILPLLTDVACDGIEALTPTPQGDVDLERIAEYTGDKILLDVIPAILFMPTYSRETLMQCVERICELFRERLILGISDELPQASGEEGIERTRMIAKWCREHS